MKASAFQKPTCPTCLNRSIAPQTLARFLARGWGWSLRKNRLICMRARSPSIADRVLEPHSRSRFRYPIKGERMAIKILVIEDETILREEVVEWMTLEGYEA